MDLGKGMHVNMMCALQLFMKSNASMNMDLNTNTNTNTNTVTTCLLLLVVVVGLLGLRLVRLEAHDAENAFRATRRTAMIDTN